MLKVENKKVALLGSSALIGAAALMATAASAQDYGIYHGEPSLLVVNNPEGTTIEGARTGIWADRGPLDLTNAGTVRGNGSYDGLDAPSEGGVVIAGGTSSISNSGTISGGGVGITTNYYYNADTNSFEGRSVNSTVENSGAVIGDTNDGIRLIGGGTITNSGLIAGRGGEFADGISMYRFDDQDMTGEASIGTVVNQAGGTIEGNRFAIILSGGGVIENAGTIRGPAYPTGFSDGAAGILVQSFADNDVGQTGTITNTGLVTGGMGVAIGGSLDSAVITNSGDIEGQAISGVQNDSSAIVTILNEATGTITGATSGVYAEFGAVVVNNAGTIRGNGAYDGFDAPPDGGIGIAQGGSSVVNSGTISGAGTGITTAYFYNAELGQLEGRAIGTTVENSGDIIGDTNDGVRLIGGGTITNSGLIAGRLGDFADGISMYAFDGQDTSGQTSIGTIVNQVGGVIEGNRNGIILTGGGVIENAGTIRGPLHPSGFSDGATGVLIQDVTGGTGKTGTITNTGLITGGSGVEIGGGLDSAVVTNSGSIEGLAIYGLANNSSGIVTVNNEAEGSIEGATSGIYAEFGAIVVNNAGTIRGNGAYDGFDFPPDGGIGIAQGGSSVVNGGTISGAGTGITTAYFYNAELGQLEGRATGTTVENSGDIIGDSNDGIRLIGGGTITNSGTIEGRINAFADGVSMFYFEGQDTAGEASIGSIVNQAGGTISGVRFGAILTGGGVIDNAGTMIGGEGGIWIQEDRDEAGKTGTVTNSGTISGHLGVAYAANLDSSSLVNNGEIDGTGSYGVVNYTNGATLTLTNQAGGAITGATSGVYAESGPLVLNNAGTIRGNGTYDGFEFTPDGGVGIAQPDSRVVNSGTISGAGTGITTAYVYNPETDALEGLAIGTTVENSGSIIGDGNDGVRLIGGGTIANSGRIAGRVGDFADGISMFGFDDQDLTGQASIGTVVNAAGGTIEGQRFGIILSGGGVVENAGTISGNEGAMLIQIQGDVPEQSAALINSGTLVGGAILSTYSNSLVNTGTITSGTGPAVLAFGTISLDNAGTITGTGPIAVQFDVTDDRLTLRTGSSITGAVDAGEGIDGVTLVGTNDAIDQGQRIGALANFETLTVDSGYWSTHGAVGEFGAVAIKNGATLKVTQVNLEEGGESPIGTSSVINDGLIVLDFATDDVVSNLDNLSISGAGGIRLEGEAVFTVDTDNLTHTGTTTVANGGLVLTSSLQGDVVTSGDGFFQLGDGGTTGTFEGDLVNNGEFIFNRSDDYDFLGDFSGSGLLTKKGNGTLTFTGLYDFTGTTAILGGSVRLAGQVDPETEFELGEEGALDVSGAPQTIGGLAGEQGSSVNVDQSTLTVDQTENSVFAGTISGDGGIVKEGDGILNLTGNSTYTGPTSVNGGILAVNGSIASNVTVNSGGKLGGNGFVGNTTVAAGGIVGPGNSIGRLTVNGDLDFAAGSIYEVEVNAAGMADRIDVTGAITISEEASVQVLAEEGDYRPRTNYTILTAGEGVTGTFGTVTTDLAFLTPRLAYGADTVTLSLLRNDIHFADVAVTRNQTAVAGGVQGLGFGNAIFEEVLVQNAAGAQAAFDSLSGEVHASTLSGLTNDGRHVRDAMLETMRQDAERIRAWGRVLGSWGDADARNGVAELDTDYRGLIAGMDFGTPLFRFGFAAGLSGSDYDVDARASKADVESRFLGAQASYAAGAFRAGLGATYAWHDIDASRRVDFGDVSQSLASDNDATTFQLFGELSYSLDLGGFGVMPFARLAHVRTEADDFRETGGSASLDVAEAEQETNFLALGVEARANQDGVFQPRLSLAWQHGWGDLTPAIRTGFASGGPAFTIVGTRIAENAVLFNAGFDAKLDRFRIGAGYVGSLSDKWSSHGAQATVTFAF